MPPRETPEPPRQDAPRGAGDLFEVAESAAENALTSIPRRIHCVPTQAESEGDQAMIKAFQNTLAEVAMAVAGRQRERLKP